MRSFVIVLLSLFFAFSVEAQNQTGQLVKAKKLKGKKYRTIHRIIGQDDLGVYAVKSSKADHIDDFVKKPVLERYDENLNLVHSMKLDKRPYAGFFLFEELIQFNNDLVMFFTTMKKGQNVFYQKIDKQTLQPIGSPEQVSQSQLPLLFKPQMLKKINIEVSPDGEKVMVFFRHPTGAGQPATFDMAVFGPGMEKEWEYTARLTDENRYVHVSDAKIDNDGRVHFVIKQQGKNREVKQGGEPESRSFLQSYSRDGRLASTELVSQFDPFSNMMLGIDVQGGLHCVSIYSNYKKRKGSAGLYTMKLAADTHEVIYQEYNAFTEQLTSQGYRAEDPKSKVTVIGNLNPSRILAYSDGTIGFIAEERTDHVGYEYRNPSSQSKYLQQGVHPLHQNQMNSQKTERYRFGSVYAFKFNSDGTEQWSSKVLKNQHSKEEKDFYLSHGLAFLNDKIYMVFNENVKNFEVEYLEDYKGLKGKNNNQVVMVGFDREGQKSKSVLAKTKDIDVFARPIITKQVENNQLILFGQLNRKAWMGRIDINPNLATN
ncbi:hypothetical protein KI659_14940 [Litoribacter alkaliphilus]|uniref:Uncharacterized protein n=1 Tax=Litoribacter ruber TaxID=702568 RepID=A0AAP2CIE2_9BACT|nr:hypothetical protein [Litoribacter alkaliphilus]MBS9525313.1 hypothetical protein [Litoribacter alkaliphilus]